MRLTVRWFLLFIDSVFFFFKATTVTSINSFGHSPVSTSDLVWDNLLLTISAYPHLYHYFLYPSYPSSPWWHFLPSLFKHKGLSIAGEILRFYSPQNSLSFTQSLATSSCPEPGESSPHISLKFIFILFSQISKIFCFLKISLKVLYAHLISSKLISEASWLIYSQQC